MGIYYTPPVLLKRHAMLATLNVSPPFAERRPYRSSKGGLYEENNRN